MRDSGAGITHSLPQVMGVEAAGEVVEAAPGSGLKPGLKAISIQTRFAESAATAWPAISRSARA